MCKSNVLAVLVLLALAGGGFVSSAAAQPAGGLCTKPNEHCITVTIGKDASGAGKIGVDVPQIACDGTEPRDLLGRSKTQVRRSTRFPNNGIEFKSPAGKQEFKCGPNGNSKVVFRCTDPNKTKGTFEYGVKVDGAPAVPPLDPVGHQPVGCRRRSWSAAPALRPELSRVRASHVRACAIACSYDSARPAASAAFDAAGPSASRACAISGTRNASSAGSRCKPGLSGLRFGRAEEARGLLPLGA